MKVKAIYSLIVTLFPFSKFRIFLLNLLFGYKIDFKSNIGFCNIISFDTLILKNSKIGAFNRLVGNKGQICGSSLGNLNIIKFVNNFFINNSMIYNRNSIIGTKDDNISSINKNDFILNDNSLITHRHYFDISYGIIIGKNVVFGGEQTQCWTHGYNYNRELKGNSILLGDNIYVGSRSIICPGVNVGNKVTIGAGTIVHRNISESGVYVSNELKLKKSYEE